MILYINIFLSIGGFYLFCICMAHVFMYKPDKSFLTDIKKVKSAYFFALLGIGILVVFNKLKLSERWVYPAYIGCFLVGAIASFALITTKI